MEVDEIQSQACKLPRIGNSRNDPNKIGQKGEQYQDEDEEDGERKGGGGSNGAIAGSETGRLRGWNSSRIIRVSRASGGKDRHSKVLTAKGLRDRRVRLSVATAIQFYDLQDRLGVDQPSKAIEWLIKAAADAIAELPSLDSKFPETPKQPSDEKRTSAFELGFDPADVELETEPSYQQQHMSLTKSTCSSTSETSKGSVLSLSRSESRVKARERARERTAKDKEKEKQNDEPHVAHQQNSHNSSFTELLTGGANNHNPTASAQQNLSAPNYVFRPTQQSPTISMDYYTSGHFLPASSRTQYSSGFSGHSHFGIAPPHQAMTAPPPFNLTNDHHPEQQQFSFLSDHFIPDTAAVTGGDYNLNFTISSSFAGFNRGTLQSNSPLTLPHLQRFSSPADGPNMPYYVGNVVASAAPHSENQFPDGFDGRLQLCYGDGSRHSDLKGKGKS